MTGKTIAEKILSNHSGVDAREGQIVICKVDHVMMHDANGPLAIRAFREMGKTKVFDPKKVTVVFDHCSPPANEKLANIHAFVRGFAKEQGCNFYEAGRGVCHQLMVESGNIHPGDLIVGTDSHTCTYGALGALATGLGATDVATVMATGHLWFKVPKTIKINLNGKLPKGLSSKDVILYTIGTLTAKGGNYQSVEFYGDYLDEISESQRLTMANMVVEMGCKCGFICHSKFPVMADDDAVYAKTVDIDLSKLEPVIAKPHTVDNMCFVGDVEGIKIQQAVLGSCTNGRLEDLQTAARILGGKRVADGVRLMILPASETIMKEAAEDGTLIKLINAGATICTPGCGCCVGTLGGVPSDGEVVISSTNRNFKGRMGNNKAFIYLASPETVAYSALRGQITDPRKEM